MKGNRPRRRPPAPKLDGWLILDKPSGMTSTGCLNAVRRVAGGAKAGHAGTLDPLATGVLPIAFGAATKTVTYAMDGRKSYRFRVRWGEARDTDDADGQVTETSDVRPDQAAVEAALAGFQGTIMQVPPVYSAIKVAGERAYDLARADKAPALEARPVRIDRFALAEIVDVDHADFLVTCGKGAYMRGLARDLARALGTVGHIAALRRTSVGGFDEGNAITLESVQALGHIDQLRDRLLPVETALADIPALPVTGSEAADLRQGQAVQLFRASDSARIGQLAEGAVVRAMADEKLVALARFEGGSIHPVRVLNP